ncbi:splicing factor 3B subunit 4 [Planoprotostelium fungivorum]|uniref:Splicing factor 3B subunit 4 n=1 Tax=Planoprotostelium fungivorum TaxID=1890364 RepID=A0A2P6P0L9_9EUKA|nr:splicing factor 3B subunit 4 [Planoprotostelium fungivorum]
MDNHEDFSIDVTVRRTARWRLAVEISWKERNQEATCWVGDLDTQVTDSLLWELMIQAGPVANVHMPKDKLSGSHSGYGFVEFASEEDADYAIMIMSNVKLFGKPIRVNRASDKGQLDIGANIFVGNLSQDVDEKLLAETFASFGGITATPKIMRDEGGGSKGFGFLSFDTFEASDASIAAMNGQFFGGRQISVTYALRKGSKTERHGSQAERTLAARNPRVKASQLQAAQAPPPPTFAPPMPAYPGGFPGQGMGMPYGMMPPGGMMPQGMAYPTYGGFQ